MNHNDSHQAPSGAAASNNQYPQPQHFHADDSSDDEMPVVMKLSALTKAILNDGAPEQVERPASPPRTRRRTSALNASTSSATESRRHLRSGSMQAYEAKTSRATSPAGSRDASPIRRRVVRLSNTPQSLNQLKPTKRRSTSNSRSTQRSRPSSRPESRDSSSHEKHESQSDINTPSQGGRVVRIASGSSGNRSRLGSTAPSSGRSNQERSMIDRSAIEAEDEQPEEPPSTVNRNPPPFSHGSVSRYPSTSNRTRPEDNMNLQSSMRVKRVGKVSGSFLSGPARRGRRRQSEEDEVNGEGEPIASSQEPESQPAEDAAYYGDGIRNFNSGSPVSGNAAARAIHRRNTSNLDLRTGSAKPSPREPLAREPSPRVPSPRVPTPEVVSIRERTPEPEQNEPEEIHYKVPMALPEMPSRRDQENNIMASYKRTKPSVDDLVEKAARPPATADIAPLRTVSPERKPLAAVARNTPHRQVPAPPPKMSIIDAATTTAGAATATQGKQRRNILRVNGKVYTRLDVLGRGGSAKVYRVTPENGTMLALKRVSLENIDDTIFRGYMGEIDLLEKLKNADRVINLIDHELNMEKKVLTLVMELGDLDLGTLLKSRTKSEYARFDPVFVRFYWKEMVECVRAIHEYDVVHSDLKPANFVLVKGTLKLIDFGIANAIQTDETVNVHRDTNVGTPNYMSPESLMDSNNSQGGRVPGRAKLVKLGKPSDVWSLGCILYQMVYGMAPFAHIATQFSRCQAIINWNHEIEFPSRGMGGAPVPPSLLRTMRRCLNRDQHMRPTCDELLYESDPFLYPAELTDKALPIDEELLGRIIQSVVTRCRERMPTEAETLSVWPQAYWSSVKKAMANRM